MNIGIIGPPQLGSIPSTINISKISLTNRRQDIPKLKRLEQEYCEIPQAIQRDFTVFKRKKEEKEKEVKMKSREGGMEEHTKALIAYMRIFLQLLMSFSWHSQHEQAGDQLGHCNFY